MKAEFEKVEVVAKNDSSTGFKLLISASLQAFSLEVFKISSNSLVHKVFIFLAHKIREGDVMKILVGIDGSSNSYDTLKYAISEAKMKRAKLTAVYSQIGKGKETEEEVRQGREIIKRAEKMMQDEGIEPDARLIMRGLPPAIDLVRFAEENGYDQIVIGSRGLSGITRILLGSVADEVVRKAHCPVTVFRK